MLNISPKADGTIPENQREVLLEIGAWLEKYGEAIYGTRPFVSYGHGPTTAGKSHFGGIALDKGYTAADVRYTRKANTVYAILLGTPGAEEETVLEAFADSRAAKLEVKEVSLVGSKAEIRFEQTPQGIKVTAPAEVPEELAIVYKVRLK